MILQEIKQYMQSQPSVTMLALCHKFSTDADVLRNMLGVWIRKGKVQQLACNSGCGSSCQRCQPLLSEIYQWIS